MMEANLFELKRLFHVPPRGSEKLIMIEYEKKSFFRGQAARSSTRRAQRAGEFLSLFTVNTKETKETIGIRRAKRAGDFWAPGTGGNIF